MHHGPFGEDVREHFLRPDELSAHAYLRTPEIVEDIAIAAREVYGVDLLAVYTAANARVRRELRHAGNDASDEARAVEAACWYVRAAASCRAFRLAERE